MPRKVVIITHPDGTKKVIVGKQSTSQPTPVDTSKPVSAREEEKDRRTSYLNKEGLVKNLWK